MAKRNNIIRAIIELLFQQSCILVLLCKNKLFHVWLLFYLKKRIFYCYITFWKKEKLDVM